MVGDCDVCFRSRVAANHRRGGSLIPTRDPEREDASEFNLITCSLPSCFSGFSFHPPTFRNADSGAPNEASASTPNFGDGVCTDICHVRETPATLPKENRATYLLGTETVSVQPVPPAPRGEQGFPAHLLTTHQLFHLPSHEAPKRHRRCNCT